MTAGAWSTQQLPEFLAVVSSSKTEAAAKDRQTIDHILAGAAPVTGPASEGM